MDIRQYEDGDDVLVPLSSHFDFPAETVFSTDLDGDAAIVTVETEALRVQPIRPGTATLIVTATSSGGTAQDTVAISILDRCDSRVLPGDDYFPAEDGTQWTFQTRFGRNSRMDSPDQRTTGTTTWHFARVGCSQGESIFEVRETFDGIGEVRDQEEWTEWRTIGPAAFTRTLHITRRDSIQLSLQAAPLETWSGPLSGYPNGQYAGEPIPASYPLSSPSVVRTENCPCDQAGQGYTQELGRGIGLLHLSFDEYISLGGGAVFYEHQRDLTAD